MIRRLLSRTEFPAGLFVVLFGLTLAISTDNFLTSDNLANITRQITVIGILAIAMALSILSGGIDLSVGATLGLTVVVCGTFIQLGWPMPAVFVVAVLVGAACGLVNGVLIVGLRIAPIIVTLGTLQAYRGIAFVYAGGEWQSGLPAGFLALGRGFTPLIVLLAVAALFIVVMRSTAFGRHVYALGGDEHSAEYAGIGVRSTKVWLYTVCGALAGVAAMVFLGRTGVVQPSAGDSYEMQAIAAAVIGGVLITGGRGSMFGTLLGVLVAGLLMNGMTLLKISAYWQGAVTGTAIVVALLIESARSKSTLAVRRA